MEKLVDSYQQLVDRAILLGLIKEESKPYYLLGCGEEAESDSNIKTSNSCDIPDKHKQLNSSFERTNILSLKNSKESKQNSNPAVQFNAKKTQGEDNAISKDPIPVSGRSIENYSILGIDNFLKMANPIDSDSESSDISEVDRNSSPDNSPAIKLNKVRKKPKKNEVVDFQVPIYLDISRKRKSTKTKKEKTNFLLQKRGCVKNEISTLQNNDEKGPQDENPMNKRTLQICKPKHHSKSPKLINLTNNDKNSPKPRRCISITNELEWKYKCAKQMIQENSSPKRMEKNTRCSRVLSSSPEFFYSKNRSDSQSSMITFKSPTIPKVKEENVEYKDRFSTTIPKLVNLTINDKNSPKPRRCDSITKKPQCKYKCTKQMIQEISSPKRMEKNTRCSRVLSSPPDFFYSKNRSDLQSSMRTIKSPTIPKIKEENVQYKDRFSTTIPKLVNLTINDKNSPKPRRGDSITNNTECKYKCTEQKIQETSSPKRMEKHTRCSKVLSSSPEFFYIKNRSDSQSPARTIKSMNIPKIKENVDYKERFSTTFQSFHEIGADERSKDKSNHVLFKSSKGRRLDSKNLTRYRKSNERRFFKCNHFEKPEFLSDDSSWKESTDSEAGEVSSQKLINLNIVCQFFSNDLPEGKQDSKSEEITSQSEKVENAKITSTDSEAQPSKNKSTRRSTAHFLSKLFSRTKTH